LPVPPPHFCIMKSGAGFFNQCTKMQINMNILFNKYRCVFLLAMICWSGPGFGQGFYQIYTPSGNYFLDLCIQTDASIHALNIGPNGHLYHVNGVGASISTTNLQAPLSGVALIATQDGGTVTVVKNAAGAFGFSSILIRRDASGQILWQTPIEDPVLPNTIKSIAATSDGGFMCVGSKKNASGNFEIGVFKLDANGNLSWSSTLGLPGIDIELTRILALSDGNFAIGGTVLNIGNNRDFYVAKVTNTGVALFQKIFPKPAYQTLSDLAETPDGGIVLMGASAQVDPVKLALLKVQPDGTEQWFKNLNTAQSFPNNDGLTFSLGFVCGDNGHFYFPVSGSNGSSFSPRLYLFEADALGNMVTYSDLGIDAIIHRCIMADDNTLVMAGESGNQSVLLKTQLDGSFSAGKITGKLFLDQNDNCAEDPGENLSHDFLVEARNTNNQSFFSIPDDEGNYAILVNEGEYEVLAHPLQVINAYYTYCDTPQVTVGPGLPTVNANPIAVQSATDAAYMRVEISAPFFRRCMGGTYTVYYCNQGNQTATDVQVLIDADALLSYTGVTGDAIPSINGQAWTFNLPDMPPGECASFYVQFQVSCSATLGQNICSSAHIFPDDVFLSPGPNWDGANLEISGDCAGSPQFRIKNTGNDMAQASEYVIIEDNIMFMGSFRLEAGEDTLITPVNLQLPSYFIRASQTPGHPGYGNPSLVIEACSNLPGADLMMELGYNDPSPVVDIFCGEAIGSFDPNDKRGIPLGWKTAHLIEPDQALSYMIRFQNTGNDTAFTVRITDQLPPELNPASIRPGASSHPYTWSLLPNGLLRFQFDNILLPDSNTNEAASHGYVVFHIDPKAGLSAGTQIINEANIYFDFNEPVLTAPWVYEIGGPLVATEVLVSTLAVQVSPNPASDVVFFNCPDNCNDLVFKILDAQGRTLTNTRQHTSAWTFARGQLPAGLYWYQIYNKDGRTAVGKIMFN
jgi:uncharacterized repeat protein (TIGR01451 family)